MKNAVDRVKTFSPRTRGCSLFIARASLTVIVFPAHAGMFRIRGRVSYRKDGFPRARGDVPLAVLAFQTVNAFSPRTRGCSLYRWCWFCPHLVFPAHAGMFLEDNLVGL